MQQLNISYQKYSQNKFYILALVFVFILAVLLGLAGGAGTPLLILAGIVSLVFLSLLVIWPDSSVVMAAFIVYTNFAVVMTKFHGMPKSIGYIVPILLLIPFLRNFIRGDRTIKINFVFFLIMIYFFVMILGSIFSRNVTIATTNLITFVAEGILLYFLFTNTIRSASLLKQVVWVLLIAGALMGGLSLFQEITGTPNNNYWGFAQVSGEGFATEQTLQGAVVQPRQSGPIGEKNRYAQIMLMLVPLGLFQAWGEHPKKVRLVAWFLTGLIFIGASLSFSRGAQIGFLILTIIMTLMRYIKLRQLLVVLVAIVLLLLAFPQNTARFTTLGNVFASTDAGGIKNADGSIQGRITEMLAALYVFIDHPVVGVGPGMFRYEMEEYSKIVSLKNITVVREAHNLYLGVAAESGVLGFLSLMGIIFYTLYRLSKARSFWLKNNNSDLANLCTGFYLAIISYMTTGIFLHMSYIRYFWMIVALAVVASDLPKNEKNKITEEAEV